MNPREDRENPLCHRPSRESRVRSFQFFVRLSPPCVQPTRPTTLPLHTHYRRRPRLEASPRRPSSPRTAGMSNASSRWPPDHRPRFFPPLLLLLPLLPTLSTLTNRNSRSPSPRPSRRDGGCEWPPPMAPPPSYVWGEKPMVEKVRLDLSRHGHRPAPNIQTIPAARTLMYAWTNAHEK